MRSAIVLLLLLVAASEISNVSARIYFKEEFDAGWDKRWVVSDWKKSDGTAGKIKVSAGDFYGDADRDKGLMTAEDARFYAVSTLFPEEFTNEGKNLVIQFTVKHPQNIDCGGGYLKLFPAGQDLKKFSGDSKYNIMFGPDVCGTSTKKTHVIFNYEGKNLDCKKSIRGESDQMTHLYTLIVKMDNTYEVQIDGSMVESGSLEADWDFLPPKMIKDPEASKPSDWVDDAKMPDPEDTKPANWDDEPAQIPDPEAEKPDDWDDEADGKWEAPTIDNPKYKGVWTPKLIDNPAFKGVWVHPEIANPEYKENSKLYAYKSFGGVGIDVWQVKSGTIFDHIIVTDSLKEAKDFADATYFKSKDAEKKMFDDLESAKRAKEEAERKAREEEEKKKKEAEEDDDEDEDDDDDEKDEL